jgi:hypothetical protein
VNPQAAKAGLSLGLFIVIASVLLLPFEPPGSAEFVVTVLSLIIGIVMVAVVGFVIRKLSR